MCRTCQSYWQLSTVHREMEGFRTEYLYCRKAGLNSKFSELLSTSQEAFSAIHERPCVRFLLWACSMDSCYGSKALLGLSVRLCCFLLTIPSLQDLRALVVGLPLPHCLLLILLFFVAPPAAYTCKHSSLDLLLRL